MVETLDAAIEERKRDGTEGHVNDFLDLMMIAEKENDTKEREPLTRSEIHTQRTFVKTWTVHHGQEAYGVFGLDLVKAVVVGHFNKFVDRSATIEYEPPFRDILLNLKGEHWKRVRAIVSPTFTSGRIKKMAPHVERNVKNLLEYLRQKQETGEEIELKETSGQFALDVIASVAFGLKVDSLQDPKNKFAVEAGKVVKPNLL
uniref:Cytochrome P450 n=1 Tax=Biomphalaria glabrata TaxID=6526 RepID=A0A2C9K183_BIOGL